MGRVVTVQEVGDRDKDSGGGTFLPRVCYGVATRCPVPLMRPGTQVGGMLLWLSCAASSTDIGYAPTRREGRSSPPPEMRYRPLVAQGRCAPDYGGSAANFGGDNGLSSGSAAIFGRRC
eukprot:590154-Rhodomonas_salina.2